MTEKPRFVFALAQPASARWLKQDIAGKHPELRFAFSRPGLYTFKLNEAANDFELGSVFAQHWGFSLGAAETAEQVHTLATNAELPWSSLSRARLRLFVSERDEGEEAAVKAQAAPPSATTRVDTLRSELLKLGRELFDVQGPPALGDWVLDVVVPREPDEALFVGYHRHDAKRARVPGGVTRVLPPSHAPSRAYSKLQEALAWSELPLRAGQNAVEIGCAPGGAVLALLERGLTVTGIDPAEMAPELAPHIKSGAFVHLKQAVGEVTQNDLPKQAQWLLCDANLAPQTALRYLSRMAKMLRPHLQAIVFTIKLNDERIVAALPELFEALGKLSKKPADQALRAIQLPSHRREIVAVLRL
jgi:23S rRNA (cytidine2498-2'-O)-methyltransferase